jgi:hypothetical protein
MSEQTKLFHSIEIVNLRFCTDWGKPGDVRVDRTSKWGNPFILKKESDRERVLQQYEHWLDFAIAHGGLRLDDLKHAKRFGCWCVPKKCHAEIIRRKIEEMGD